MPKLINTGLVLSCIFLFLLLTISVLFRKYPSFGFALSLITCLMIGVSGNIVQLSYFALINYVSDKIISRFIIGTAISGFGLTVIRMFILAVSGTKIKSILQIILYFAIAIALLLFDILVNTLFCKS
jgi:hypothetical protein